MAGPASAQQTPLPSRAPPSWAGSANWRAAFVQGLRIIFEVPALILAATGAGFGALAHDSGMEFGHAAFMSIVLYATPAQVVLVDQFARGASLLGGAFAVALTAVRLLPMMVSLMPYLRGPNVSPGQYAASAHYIAITGWNEGFRRLPQLPEHLRMPYFLGMGTMLMIGLTTGTMIGFELAGSVPPLLTSALLFMTPLYFAMSLVTNAKNTVDWLALGAGFVLGPILFVSTPGFDLLLTGLIGGTFAFLMGRRRKGSMAAKSEHELNPEHGP